MANLHRWKPDSEDRRRRSWWCKRHPKHRQSPGVCSLCLAEKLWQIVHSGAAAREISDSLSSDSSSYCSSCSSCSSPNPFGHHPRKPNLMMLSMFRKSRSMAVIEPRLAREIGDQKSRSGFWWRLGFLRNKNNNNNNNNNMEFMQSSTTVVHAA